MRNYKKQGIRYYSLLDITTTMTRNPREDTIIERDSNFCTWYAIKAHSLHTNKFGHIPFGDLTFYKSYKDFLPLKDPLEKTTNKEIETFPLL
jgi:hypothetical protein